MSSLGNLYCKGINAAQNHKSKTLSWLLDVIFAATSFNPPRGHFQASSNKWQKITWFKYRQIPKRNYFLLACSILIISLPKVSLIPRHQFSVISASISSFISVASSFSSCSFMSSFSSLLLQKDQNWYQESWLGLIQNYEGSTTSPNFWRFFINHFDLEFRCPAGVIYIEVVSMLHKTKSKLFLDC